MKKEIKPFNDFFLKSCYDSFSLSQLANDNQSINGFLKNYDFHTQKNGDECKLILSKKKSTYDKIPIQCERKKILNKIRVSLENEKPILVVNDKKDEHYLLIGKSNHFYLIISQKAKGSQSFGLKKISSDDLAKNISSEGTELFYLEIEKNFCRFHKLIFDLKQDLKYFLDCSINEYERNSSSFISYETSNNLLNLIKELIYIYKEEKIMEEL